MVFGEIANAEQDKQPYKYNGKELDRVAGLNLYDYEARQYEPAWDGLRRWILWRRNIILFRRIRIVRIIR